MPYIKSQPKSLLGSGEKDFKCFYHIWARRPSCLMSRDRMNKLSIYIRQKAHMKSGENYASVFFFRKKTFKNSMIFYTYSQGARANNPQGTNFSF